MLLFRSLLFAYLRHEDSVSIGVRLGLYICLFLAGLLNNYSTGFHIIRWKGATRATEEIVDIRIT